MAETTTGQSAFTNDPYRHMLTENELSLPSETKNTHLLPDKKTCLIVVNCFFDNTQGAVEIFDEQKFLEAIDQCYSDPLSANRSWLCLLNLVLAIGLVLATPFAGSPEAVIIENLRRKQPNQSDAFYYNARQLSDPVLALENADFWTVQALMLVTVYMLCRSKRNTAYTYLGMAVRTAYSLGLHREEALVIFSAAERDIRRQVWRSLYIMDRFLTISLGRPTAIAQEDCSGDALDPAPGSPDPSRGQLKDINSGLEAGVRGCHFMTIVLKRIYQQRNVSTKVAREIGDLCKEWPKRLPRSLHWRQATPKDRRQAMAILHVNTLYCYSVLLFTRPFFTYLLSTEMQRTYLGSDQVSRCPHRKMEVYSEACTIAALHSIALVKNAYDGGYLPRQNPFIIFSLFSAALVILSGKFVPRTTHAAADRFIEDATTLLSYCAQSDTQAAKMLQIFADLGDVVSGRREGGHPSKSTSTTQIQPPLTPSINHSRQQAPPSSERDKLSRESYKAPGSPPNLSTPQGLPTAVTPVMPQTKTSPGGVDRAAAAPGTARIDPAVPSSSSSYNNGQLSGLLDRDVNIFPTGSEDSSSGAEEHLDFDSLWKWPGTQPPALNQQDLQNMGVLDVSNSSVPLFGTTDLTEQY